MVSREERQYFDEQLAWVMEHLPAEVHALIEEIPLIVDDEPSPAQCAELGLESPDELLGLYQGVPTNEQSIEQSNLPEVVFLFREGILCEATDEEGNVSEAVVREEIRKTILHEYGHHHGLDEDELGELGY